MPDAYRFTVAERFLSYVTIDTQSDPDSNTQPSTGKQRILGALLVDELQAMGIRDAHLDEYGYVYATIPATADKDVPVICFCAHMDTSPDCSGYNVRPIVHRNYDGSDIVLPEDTSQVITTAQHPYLAKKIGDDIITASGNTLLGADDKAGIAVIMDMANYLMANQDLKHGAIKILFTPDEEIGRGVNSVDLKKLGAKYAYTLDGGELGSFEDETFSADGVLVHFYGVSTHPGEAKDKLVNAIKIAAEFVDELPRDAYSPETTSGREGFFHPVKITGAVEKATVEFIIRDFHTHKLLQYQTYLRDTADTVARRYPGARAEFIVHEQYRNMKEVLDNFPQVSEYAREAMRRAGVTVIDRSARGGTDGSRLSFMGLPCPNIFTGEMAFHGKHEFVSIQDMQKSVDTIIQLSLLWHEKS